MDQNETLETETSSSAYDKFKTGAEAVVITFTVITAAKGLYDLAQELKEVAREKRAAKKAKQEEE